MITWADAEKRIKQVSFSILPQSCLVINLYRHDLVTNSPEATIQGFCMLYPKSLCLRYKYTAFIVVVGLLAMDYTVGLNREDIQKANEQNKWLSKRVEQNGFNCIGQSKIFRIDTQR